MRFFEAVRLALATIRVQKLKSFFTALGVCIGVMFLIAVVSIVDGMGRYMENDLVGKLIALNSFELRHRPNINIGDVDPAVWREYARRPRILESDVQPVVDALPEGSLWSMYSEGQLQVESQYSPRPRSASITAIDGQYFEIKRLGVTDGRTFTPGEVSQGASVVVLGPDLVKRLFPTVGAIGRQVKMGGKLYTVVGIGESLGSAFGMSFDNYIYAPFRSPVHRLLNREAHAIDAVVVQTPTAEALPDAEERVRAVMRARHKLRPAQPDNFSLQTADSALAFWDKIKGYLVLAGIALPAFGLVVGAIVIMNIMLVAVAERTHEIGIRKALGAKRRDILIQFLIESATLSTFGAALGIGAGAALALIIRSVTPMPTFVAPWSIMVAVVVGAGVGVISGVYPASRASLLDPVAALRQE
ncbi:MAG TPA: ABC transporter permease [Gemmatimonadaceae bacterium]|nr:ABC transporter permease [Gemmatimonadaceae bacterium]